MFCPLGARLDGEDGFSQTTDSWRPKADALSKQRVRQMIGRPDNSRNTPLQQTLPSINHFDVGTDENHLTSKAQQSYR